MSEYAGPLQRLVLARTLWLAVAFPFCAFVWHALAARVLDRRRAVRSAGRPPRPDASARVGFVSVVLATVATLANVVAFQQGGRRPLLEHMGATRIGALDLGADLWFDDLSAAASALACALALVVAVYLTGRPEAERGWRPWAWLELSLSGALLAFLADGFVATAIAWALAGAAAGWLSGWRDARAGAVAVARSALGMAALVLAACLIFWTLGDAWRADGSVAEPSVRIAAVHVPPSTASQAPSDAPPGTAPGGASASLTFTGAAGALVFLDDVRSPAMHAPFVAVSLPPGPHALRIHTGAASRDSLVRTTLAADDDAVLVPLGASLSFHEMAAALAVRDGAGGAALAGALARSPGPAGEGSMAIALVALMVAAGAMSAWPMPAGAPSGLMAMAQAVSVSALGPFLLARTSFLAALAPRVSTMVTWLGAATLAGVVTQAFGGSGARRWIPLAAGMPAPVAWIALGVGGVDAASGALVGAGMLAAAVVLVGPEPGSGAAGDPVAATEPAPADAEDEELLERALVTLGVLFTSFERWVVDPIVAASAGLVRAAAWVAARWDARVLARPVDAIAGRAVRLARGVEPAIGVSLTALAWTAVAVAVLAGFAHWLGAV